MRPAALLFLDDWHWQLWGNFFSSVQTGEPAFEPTFGTANLFTYLDQHPQIAHQFDQSMASNATLADAVIVESYDFHSMRRLVDVGGGRGSLLLNLLQRYPNLTGILFERPAVIEQVKQSQSIETAHLTNRYELIAGDCCQSVPAGADAYLFKHVMHRWDDATAIAILKNCRRAIAPGGKLLLAELMVPIGNKPSISKVLDLQMLAVLGGQERTEIEYRGLLDLAGFKLTKIFPTASPWSLIEGIPV